MTAAPDLSAPAFAAFSSTPENIFGWFDWQPFYDRAVASAPPGSAVVEVGVFLGKSLVYLAERARAADKGLRVYGVDRWRGSEEFDGTVWFNGRPVNEAPPGDVLGACYNALACRGLADVATLVVSDSARAAAVFADGSAHAVFLDAAHDEASVARDIAAWRPKVAAGGLLAGHDYRPEDGFPGVKAAADAAFGRRLAAVGSWWEVRL
jgi:hypothetical protein